MLCCVLVRAASDGAASTYGLVIEPAGVSDTGAPGTGSGASPGLPLTLAAEPANNQHSGNSPDPSSLIVLQPSAPTGYSTMLPSFGHYGTGEIINMFCYFICMYAGFMH